MKYSKTVTYVLAGAGIGALIMLARRQNKVDLQGMVQTVKNKFSPSKAYSLPVEKAGLSDPMDIDDNKMVSEGSQYGVHYYNQKEQDDA
ncbi:hypothetical protein [Neobacillus terrae]|uniref:hypothetical protein n=1 Tax=Neobacillus terrae TaxID=3034837 RepID=UPI00140D767B|nr:hypothetical protein [Neobacillus terrae]NHM31517.1 hypothetical protein [Neobacillus terrae]